jgi:hypothetical protein
VFDEWVELQPAPVQASCDRAIRVLKVEWKLGDHQAKALLIQLILFLHMKPDEQNRWCEHGEYVQHEFEWAYPGLKMLEFLKQEEPA